MRKILVSECLYGGSPVRYDGKDAHCDDPTFLKWKEEGRLVPVCPEVCGGLPVPRPPAQRTGDNVMTENGRDVTPAFKRGAEEALRLAREHDVAFAIMKEGSPSCGTSRIYDGTFTGAKTPGMGITTEQLRAAGYAVFSEHEIPSAVGRLEEAK